MYHKLTNSFRECSYQQDVFYVLLTSQHSSEVSSTQQTWHL